MDSSQRIGFRRPEGLAVAACALLFAWLAACSGTTSQARRPEGRRQAVAVRTTTPRRVAIQRQVDVSGTLVSPDQAKVSSEVAGVVREVLVELGQEVQPGQVVVRLEPQELVLALRRAESLLRQTEAQLGIDWVKVKEPPPDEEIASVRLAVANREDAQAQLERSQRLSAQGLVTQADLEASRTKLKVYEASLQSALENVHSLKASLQDRRAAYELAQKKLNDATIRAPVGGQVSERHVQPGEFIRENTPVLTVVQMNPLKLRTAVQERNANFIEPGLSVVFRVEADPSGVFQGKVAHISPAIDQATRTFVVEALVDNDRRRLRPGFFAKGVILTARDVNALAVPEEAISTLAGVSTVYVIEAGKVRPQVVTLGARQDKLVEVAEGLKGDEVLAASNLSQLAAGVAVETTQRSGTPEAAQ